MTAQIEKNEAAGVGTEAAQDSKEMLGNLVSQSTKNDPFPKENIEEKKPNSILIRPKSKTARNQLKSLKESMGKELGFTWRGGSFDKISRKFSIPDMCFYSIPIGKKTDLLQQFFKIGLPIDDVETEEMFFQEKEKIKPHIVKAKKIQEDGERFEKSIKFCEHRENEEIKNAKECLEDGTISDEEYSNREREIRERYTREKTYLSDSANRNYKAADDIYEAGEKLAPSEDQQIVSDFNKKFSIIEIPFGILEFHDQTFSIQKKRDFKDRFQNQKIAVSEKKSISVADIWLDAPDRKTYFKLEFRPDKNPGEYIDQGRRYLNLWKGFGIEPKKGDCTLIKRHMLEVICSGDKQNYDYLWKLESNWVQRPSERTTVPVFRSKHGTGKGRHTDLFAKIFADSFLETSRPEDVFGNFNASIANKVLVHLDDAIFGGDKRLMGKLKTFSTAEKINIEFKGKDPIFLSNPRKLIISSNEDFAIPVEATERRYFFLDVSNDRKGDKEYFHRLSFEMENGGVEAFLYELLHTDITHFNPKHLPEGAQKFGFDNKLASSDSFHQFLFTVLREETFFLDITAGWTETIRTDVLDMQYLKFCKERQLRAVSDRIYGKTLQNIFGPIGLEKCRPSYEGIRKNAYQIPPLQKCKEAFAASFGSEVSSVFGPLNTIE